MRMPCWRARSASSARSSAARAGRRRSASSETLEQRQSSGAPSSCIKLEFARRALEIAARAGSGHRLEIAQRLQRDDLKAEIGGHPARVARLAAEEGQIVFEDLDGAEAGLGGGGKLALQCAAHADRRDRPSEHLFSCRAGETRKLKKK